MFWLLESSKTANITEKWKGKPTTFVIVNESLNILHKIRHDTVSTFSVSTHLLHSQLHEDLKR